MSACPIARSRARPPTNTRTPRRNCGLLGRLARPSAAKLSGAGAGRRGMACGRPSSSSTISLMPPNTSLSGSDGVTAPSRRRRSASNALARSSDMTAVRQRAADTSGCRTMPVGNRLGLWQESVQAEDCSHAASTSSSDALAAVRVDRRCTCRWCSRTWLGEMPAMIARSPMHEK